MKRVHHLISILYLAVHLCGVVLPGAGHTDIIEFASGGTGLTTHDCGAHERHKEIPADHFCSVCFRIANFNATPVLTLSAPATPAAMPTAQPAIEERASERQFFASALKRGPPSLLS